jgi:multidrug efflux pump subunit AcrB
MSHGKSDAEWLRTRNTARYFTETRHVGWVLLLATIAWGVMAYLRMPKRKDPDIPVRAAVALVSWPGASAERLEEEVVERVEQKLAENSQIEKIESTVRAGIAVVSFAVEQRIDDTGAVLDDVWLKLGQLGGLPAGARVEFIKDFGDTAALMLSVASPRVSDIEIQLRADKLRSAIAARRAGAAPGPRATVVVLFPHGIATGELETVARALAAHTSGRLASDLRLFSGPGFLAIDAATHLPPAEILTRVRAFASERLQLAELHPDVWGLTVIRDPAETEARLAEIAGARYSYRELERFTETIQERLQAVPLVAKVSLAGTLGEQVLLEYSQERLASHALQPAALRDVMAARNVSPVAGVMEVAGKSVRLSPAGEFTSETDIGALAVSRSQDGAPVYLRDLVDIHRGYEVPRYLNFLSFRGPDGRWQRSRAITLSVNMRTGRQIGEFGAAVDAALGELRPVLPEDLHVARVSDQPRQVRENVSLFMSSLYEAIALVVLVALLGFWEWRSALLMALSIPLTLCMTFGMMQLLGIDVQQVSIASLIIALGLLVDDPVVAGDAIKRELAAGRKRLWAAWLGPTKLATAILFATVTNIAAYLPFLALPDDSGRFIYALPVVLTCALVASRLVSMSFVPMLGYHLLRPPRRPEPSLAERRGRGFGRLYARFVGWTLDHRALVLGAALVLLAGGVLAVRGIKSAFFPRDLSYLSYVDVWLPEDAPVSATRQTAALVDRLVRDTAAVHGARHPDGAGRPRDLLESVTTFVGGGGPRFWFSVSPEQRQANYAQLVVKVRDKRDTAPLVVALQDALSRQVPGARIDVRELESGPPIGVPIQVRISGDDAAALRSAAERVKALLRGDPGAERIRDSWGAENFAVELAVDADRAHLAGVSNRDVAQSVSMALHGQVVGSLREGSEQIPIVARLRPTERAAISDLDELYVHAGQGAARVPLRQIASLRSSFENAKIVRRDHRRAITVSAFPGPGTLASEVVARLRPALAGVAADLPPGYRLQIAGEDEEQKRGFANLALVLAISISAIFLALVLQFRNAIKPLIVFAAIPFGAVGALASLRATGAPFGFMAFLGIISLIGVIVSHVIVLFDFIEERREEGAPLREALIDAGILRLRPVLITVGATVLGLFPLARNGGPLWEPLCYVQIGGLTLATLITLVLVPVLYATFVLDLRLVRWPAPLPTASARPGA